MSEQFDQQNQSGINGENAIYEEKKCDETEVKEQTKQDRVPAGCGCMVMILLLIVFFLLFLPALKQDLGHALMKSFLIGFFGGCG